MRVLVIEDETKVGCFIKRALEEESYAVDLCEDGVKGLEMALATNYDLTGGTYDAVSNRIYLAANTNSLVMVSPTTGAELGTSPPPFNVQSNAGLAVDPTTGHLWLGAANGGPQLVEYQIGGGGTLTELRRVDTRAQGLDQNEISGLAVAADGTLWVASIQGEIYKISTVVPTSALSADVTPVSAVATPSSGNLELAYIQQSWVTDYVNGAAAIAAYNNQDEELIISLPA